MSYPNYSYYGQPVYQQPPYMPSGPSNGYPQYPYPSNPNAYIPPPPTQENRETPFIPPPLATQALPSKSHRRSVSAQAVPLKSALKKPSNAPPPTNEGLTRQSTYPNQNTRPRLISNNFNRTYTSDHNKDFRPLHMFLVLNGNNELRVENIMIPAIPELRATILPMWPDGVESDAQHGHDWTVRFRNNPWALQGPNTHIAWHIIVQLFTLFARRGFAYQTSLSMGNLSPRLVFEVTPEDRTSQFFLAYFSQGGKRLTLIKPPTIVDDTLGNQLKAQLPRKIAEESVGDGLRVIEIKKAPGVAPEVEPQFFLMHVLKILAELGYNLVTSVPLGRKGPLGLRIARELLVFRGTGPADTG